MAYQLVLANSSNYAKGRGSKKIKYIVIHYTGNKGDTAMNNCKYFQVVNRKASAHYFVDENQILQSVPDADTAWSVGDGAGKYGIYNQNSISIELCNFVTYNDKVAKKSESLVRELMSKYGVSINNVVRHYDASRKICPKPFVDNIKLWNDYKNIIKNGGDLTMSQYEELKAMIQKITPKTYDTIAELPAYAKPTIQKLVNKKVISGIAPGKLGLTEEMVRIFCILDNAGMFKNL